MNYYPTIIIHFILTFSIFFSSLSFANKNSSPSIQRILDRGKLIVAMYHKDSPPFYYVNEEKQLTGVDVEMIKGFARLLNVDVEFDRTPKSFNAVVDMIANEEADVAICKLSITFNRLRRVLYTKPYIEMHQALLVNHLLLAKQLEGGVREEVLRSLSGKIGVIGKSSYVKYAKRNFSNMDIVEYQSWNDVVDAVKTGKVVAAYRDEAEIKKIIRDNPDSALNLLTVTLKDAADPKGIAVSKNSAHLKELLEFYIDSLNLNLTANKVLYDYDSIIKNIKRNTP